MTLQPNALRGAQTPRVESAPDFRTSAGEEAIELASRLNLFLDPWQQYVLERSLGERADGKWSAFEVGLVVPRRNGKGSILEAREMAGMFLFDEAKITHTAHEAKTAKDHFERLEQLLRGAGYGDSKVSFRRSTTETSIMLKSNGSKITFYTRTPDGGRGLEGDLVVLDEAYALNADQLAALYMIMGAKSVTGNPQVWYASSAGFPDSDVLSSIRKRGESHEPRLAYFDWSAPSDADDASPEAIAQANPGLGIRISMEYIESERATFAGAGAMEQWRRERLGIWADAGTEAVITEPMWASVQDPKSRRATADTVFAVAVDIDQASASIAVACENRDGKVHLELVDHKPQAGWVVDRVVDIAQRRRARVLIDVMSPAGRLIPELENRGVEVVTVGTNQASQACAGLVEAIRDGTVACPGGRPELDAAVMAGAKRPIGKDTGMWGWKRRDSRTPISPLEAITLARIGWITKPTRKTGRAVFV